MPVVVVCPACQKRARVPEPMLGKTVRCPACGATFPANNDGPATAPPPEGPAEVAPDDEPSTVVPSRPPLPADADVLRSLRAGVFLQLVAQGLYAAALAVFLLAALGSLLTSSPPVATLPGGTGFGPPTGAIMTVLASLAGLLLFGGAVACGLTGGALCTLAPVARLARGLAIAGLTLGVLELAQSATLVHWFALVSEGLPMPVTGYTRGAGLAYFVMPLLFTGLLETARLTVLALFWRALCVVLRDGTGALLGLRLAYAIPAAQGVLLLLGLVFGFFGGIGRGGESIVLVVGLVIQIGLLVWGVIVAERVWRRLRAVVPPA